MFTDTALNTPPPPLDRLIPRSSYNASTAAIATKVLADIHFLQDRISRIKKLQTPDPMVLQTYQSMLDSRESVLQWLKDHGELAQDTL